MLSPGVIKARLANHLELNFAANAFCAPNDLGPFAKPFLTPNFFVGHRHEIADLTDTVRRKEASEKNVRIWNITLSWPAILEAGGERKPSAFVRIKQISKNRGGIEIGKTAKIDGPVDGNQSHRLQIPNNAVVLNGLITVGHGSLVYPRPGARKGQGGCR